MKLKVCGMKHNALEVATLQPDYLGFIFWEPSKRYFEGKLPALSPSIKKVGVFVDAGITEVKEKVATYHLQAVQLHGKESPEFCADLKAYFLSSSKESGEKEIDHKKVSTTLNPTLNRTGIIKVFSIKEDFDFSALEPYEEVCDYYLFDTKGKLPGGNGYTFNWELLKGYPSTKPYFLSGGIGLEEAAKIRTFLKTKEAKQCYAFDVNSKFEIEPGLKHIEKLKEFKELITEHG